MDLVNYGLTFSDEINMGRVKKIGIFILGTFLFVAHIHAQNFSSDSKHKIKMKVTVSESLTNKSPQIASLTIEMENESCNDVFILNFPDFSTDASSVFQLVIKKGDQIKLSPAGLLKRRLPKSSDYKRLTCGEIFSFKYDLYLNDLANHYNDFGLQNSDYGKYTITVLYRDQFLLKRKAVESAESNSIEVEYMSK